MVCSTISDMRPDMGREELLERVAASSVEQRVTWLAAMRDAGIRSAWQQVDRAGITDPLEVAEFLLRRLYAGESEAWYDNVLINLRAAHETGDWSGFARPPT
jgi:hypothetical protein